jgi:hypothetical protein
VATAITSRPDRSILIMTSAIMTAKATAATPMSWWSLTRFANPTQGAVRSRHDRERRKSCLPGTIRLGERTLRCGVKTGRRKLICSALEMKVVDKIGLLPDVEFDRARAATQARQVNPDIVIVPLSAPTGCLLPPASPR